jgi:putative membrane protein
MFNMYDGYHFFGMHLLWWFFWIVFIGVIFGAYVPVRRNRRVKDEMSPPRRSKMPKGDMK